MIGQLKIIICMSLLYGGGLIYANLANADVTNSAKAEVTLTMQSTYKYSVNYKFFSQSDDGGYWGPYKLADSKRHTKVLNCKSAVKICYGAWSGGSYWGAGENGDKSCENCCVTCDGGNYDFSTLVETKTKTIADGTDSDTEADLVISRTASTDAQSFLAVHNKLRSSEGVSNLTWSTGLAALAQEWTDKLAREGCSLEHRPRQGVYGSDTGENLYWASAIQYSDGSRKAQDTSANDAVTSWYSEKKDYNHSTNTCRPGEVCGHYTQVIWEKSKEVGCAATVCPDKGQIWACNYKPAGNFVGQRPY
jgi:pathogenesis-related protein 1